MDTMHNEVSIYINLYCSCVRSYTYLFCVMCFCIRSPWLEGESVVFDLPENELVLGHRQGSDVAVPLSV